MPQITMRQMLEAGVHFGHQTRYWNPKMGPYIFGARGKIHIINLEKTVPLFNDAMNFISGVAQKRGMILFLGTKRSARESIKEEAERCGMPYMTQRWLGGTLTNFRTIRSRLTRLEELETIRSGDELATYSKKMQSALNREYRKMFRNLNGMRSMSQLPRCLFVVDPRKEKNSVREAKKLGITTIALIDTDCDPDWVDLPIPGNDDGIRSIEVIVSLLADAIIAGRSETSPSKDEGQEGSRRAAKAKESSEDESGKATAE